MTLAGRVARNLDRYPSVFPWRPNQVGSPETTALLTGVGDCTAITRPSYSTLAFSVGGNGWELAVSDLSVTVPSGFTQCALLLVEFGALFEVTLPPGVR